ncbi:MAG: hypothetical protein IRY89_13130 [Pseudolabrys sp.]|nr:hypothetical protein [Pseudolabrys sp.]
MRILLGMVLGALLTVGAAYVYDNHAAMTAPAPSAVGEAGRRPLVNWDVVSRKWRRLADRARSEWHRL